MAPRQRGRDAGLCKKKVADRGGRVSRPIPIPTRDASASGKITGHWGEDAVGFKWTEQDSVDNRLQQMDVGRFYSATIWTPQEMTLKGIAVRIGEKSEASILFDTELLRVVCGWTGEFLEFNPARYGIIGPPKVGKEIAFHSPRQPGWSRDGAFQDPRPKPFGPLPREWAKYRGLHLHGDRIVFEYSVGPKQVVVLDSPWIETLGDDKVFSRELEIEPSDTDLEVLVAAAGTPVKLVCEPNVAVLDRRAEQPITAKVAKHDQPVRLKLLFPFSANSASSAFLLFLFLREQRLKLRQLAERGEVRVLLNMLEVVEPGGDRFFQAVERQVEVLLPLGLFRLGGLRFVFHAECRAQTVGTCGVVEHAAFLLVCGTDLSRGRQLPQLSTGLGDFGPLSALRQFAGSNAQQAGE